MSHYAHDQFAGLRNTRLVKKERLPGPTDALALHDILALTVRLCRNETSTPNAVRQFSENVMAAAVRLLFTDEVTGTMPDELLATFPISVAQGTALLDTALAGKSWLAGSSTYATELMCNTNLESCKNARLVPE